MLDFGLVREALRERGLLLDRIAPHLVKPVPFLYPLQHRIWERAYAGTGVALYDAMAYTSGTAHGLHHHRHLTRGQALREAPCLRKDALTGAIQYWDAQEDDARFTMTVVRTAASFGAFAANRARVTGFLRQGERVTGARVIDLETDEEFEVRAKQVINATGVWTDDTQAMADTRGQFHVRASKGIHLVVPRDRLPSSTGLILRTEKSVLFVIPWGRHWIIGTTDTDWTLAKEHPAASAQDIDYLLEHINSVLNSPLTREDVEGVYAGLRPLLSGESESTSKLSREHVVGHPVPGLVVVAGGKFTTYRVMAADAVDEAARTMDARVPDSCTAEVPLIGADGYRPLWNQRRSLAAAFGIHVARVEHLLNRYGDLRPRTPRHAPRRPVARGAASRRRRLPRGGGEVRGDPRGRNAPGGRPHPPHPHLDRGVGPRRRGGAGRRRPDGGPARLDRRGEEARGGPLPRPGRRRTRVPDQA